MTDDAWDHDTDVHDLPFATLLRPPADPDMPDQEITQPYRFPTASRVAIESDDVAVVVVLQR